MKLAVGVGSRKSHREKKNPSAREAWTLDKRAGREKQRFCTGCDVCTGEVWVHENQQKHTKVDTSQA